MQEDIIKHLKDTFNPDAIILHGSRARGKEREHSDWDFIFLYTKEATQKGGRLVHLEQNIEYSAYVVQTEDIFETFGAKLQKAKVLFEKDSVGTDLLSQASEYYSEGVHWSPEKIAGHKLWARGRIDGMKDNLDSPIIFEKYYRDFSGRVFNYWYWLGQKAHSQPVYVAVEEVSEKDPDYFDLVSGLVNENALDKKVEIAESIYSRLFGSRP